MTTKKKTLTIKQERDIYRKLLEELHAKIYHEPDSDSREYCTGCGRSPYNDPPHAPSCITVRIINALKARSKR